MMSRSRSRGNSARSRHRRVADAEGLPVASSSGVVTIAFARASSTCRAVPGSAGGALRCRPDQARHVLRGEHVRHACHRDGGHESGQQGPSEGPGATGTWTRAARPEAHHARLHGVDEDCACALLLRRRLASAASAPRCRSGFHCSGRTATTAAAMRAIGNWRGTPSRSNPSNVPRSGSRTRRMRPMTSRNRRTVSRTTSSARSARVTTKVIASHAPRSR